VFTQVREVSHQQCSL